jgi:sugar phosphate isomerase/epimerase
MKVGLSIYSLWGALNSGKMSPVDAIQWIADNGGDHVEIVSFVVHLIDRDDLVYAIRDKAANCGIDISAYSIAANMVQSNPDEYKKELERVYKHIDIAHKLGVKVMRSDLYDIMGDFSKINIEYFDKVFPQLVRGAQALADYAQQYGITITVENHGTMLNGGDRVRRLLLAVDRENYKLTLDVGNSLCVDESPAVCIKTLLPWAATVHLKDFYIRKDPVVIGARCFNEAGLLVDAPPDQTYSFGIWLKSSHERYLRGAIVGHGDMDIREIVMLLQAGGYDGNLTIEFEGIEDCELACRTSIRNLKSIVHQCLPDKKEL